jgi:hypothetical protein
MEDDIKFVGLVWEPTHVQEYIGLLLAAKNYLTMRMGLAGGTSVAKIGGGVESGGLSTPSCSMLLTVDRNM